VPSPGKIAVTIVGGVKRPGRYWLSDSSNLATAWEVSGGSGGHGDFGGVGPHHVILKRMIDGHEESTKYSLKLPDEQKAAIILKDGDELFYPTIYF
jgi:protein involved in polysaccharide export with SLBB domain